MKPTGSPPNARGISRRSFLRGLGAGGALAASTMLVRRAAAGPLLYLPVGAAGTPPPEQVHLTFGANPARSMVVSWASAADVAQPQVRIGTPSGGFGRVVDAETQSYVDALTGVEVFTHHAEIDRLAPGRSYIYEVLQGDAAPFAGSFRTAPAGRAPFRFTSFGDQGINLPDDGIGSSSSGEIAAQIERVEPLFNLANGDLCYANLSRNPVQVWRDWFAENSASITRRPWMPTAGNHENEKGNGRVGYRSYQTRFALPPNGERDADFDGLWYAFTVGSVRFVCLNNDDVCYQDAGGSYIRGYSEGRQRAWLERTLADARADHTIDWIVVCMHQVVISSADFNGADLGVREAWGPLFDRYAVDLVVCGHEHAYERSHPVRGVVRNSATLTPQEGSTDLRSIDTSLGTVHLVLGGGGALPSNQTFFDPPRAKVVVGVGPAVAVGFRQAIYAMEEAGWSAVRDREHAFGFAAFDVDPGTHAGGETSIHVTYYQSLGATAADLVPFETFTLHRRRSDRSLEHLHHPRVT